MWPPKRDLFESTLAAEQVVEDLYAEALLRWAPVAAEAVLPTFDAVVITAAADELPPDPEALESTQAEWVAIAAATVLPGVAALWADAATIAAAAKPLGAIGKGVTDVLGALVDVRGDFMADYATLAAGVPATVRTELRKIILDANPDTTRTGLRALIRQAITPGSVMLRKVSRRLGYHGASILNHATMTVAKHGGGADRKCWRAILDARTRDEHWVADGQIVDLAGEFMVGGVHMAFPGDPRAPIHLTANCRCRLVMLAKGEELRPRAVPAKEAEDRAERGVVREGDEPIAASAGQETTMTETVEAAQDTDVTEPQTPEAPEPETYRTFTDAVFALIGVPSSDNRILSDDIAFEVRTPPLALTWMRHTGSGGGHEEAFTVGVIESARIDDGKVYGSGYLLNTPHADEAANLLAHGVTRPSVEFGRNSWHLADDAGEELSEEAFWDLPLGAKVFRTFTEAELIATSLVATPAFGDTYLRLNPDRETRDLSLAASAHAPRTYKAAHFSDPHLDAPTLPTIDDDGRVYGHIACWGECHRGIQDACVLAPRSQSGYQMFHTSPAVRLDDNTRLPVGRLTVGTGHADPRLGGIPAQAHYDNTGTCWALVRVGEDEHGIWFSGVAAPWASPAIIEQGLTAPLSGDWRDFGKGLELVAALSVNTPGFAARGRDDDMGRPAVLVAALGPSPSTLRQPAPLTREDIKAAVAEALADRTFINERELALARANAVTRPKTPNELIGEMLAEAGTYA